MKRPPIRHRVYESAAGGDYVARTPKSKMQRPEQLIQIGIFNFLTKLMEAQKFAYFFAFHVPQGGYRTPAEASVFKAMGTRSGIADICVLIPAKEMTWGIAAGTILPPRTIWIELKAGDTEKPPRLKKDGTPVKQREKKNPTGQSDGQHEFERIVTSYGYEYHLLTCSSPSDGLNKVLKILEDNGVPVR